MNQNMFAALLFAMLSGMHPEEPAPESSKPQSTLASVNTETESAEEPTKT